MTLFGHWKTNLPEPEFHPSAAGEALAAWCATLEERRDIRAALRRAGSEDDLFEIPALYDLARLLNIGPKTCARFARILPWIGELSGQCFGALLAREQFSEERLRALVRQQDADIFFRLLRGALHQTGGTASPAELAEILCLWSFDDGRSTAHNALCISYFTAHSGKQEN